MLPRNYSDFRRELWTKSMYCNVKIVSYTLLGKTCFEKCFGSATSS